VELEQITLLVQTLGPAGAAVAVLVGWRLLKFLEKTKGEVIAEACERLDTLNGHASKAANAATATLAQVKTMNGTLAASKRRIEDVWEKVNV
jgi:chemotaxis regulatin CheY-phosphate phosphatase CheZ